MAAHYESDITKFINELKQKKPTLEAEQRAGRSIYWDRQQDADETARWKAARVPQRGYVYQTKVK